MHRVVSGWQVLVRWLRLKTKLGPLGRRCGYRIEERPVLSSSQARVTSGHCGRNTCFL